MAGLYIKLDHDWLRDPKVRNFRREAGKAGLVDLVQLYILMSRGKGRVDLKDPGQLEDARDVMGMPEKRLFRFLDLAADCGVIDGELWASMRVVTSGRAAKDAAMAGARSEAGRAGGEASGRARSRREPGGAAAEASR